MLALCVAFASVHAIAAPGSKNFTSPPYVPNYFSSEAGSFQGNATAQAPQPGAGPVFAAPAPRRTVAVASRRAARYHAVRVTRAHRYLRLVRSKAAAHRQYLDARIARVQVFRAGVADSRAARRANAQPRAAGGKAIAAKTRPAPIKGKSFARARG
jgi:hypothetical protein